MLQTTEIIGTNKTDSGSKTKNKTDSETQHNPPQLRTVMVYQQNKKSYRKSLQNGAARLAFDIFKEKVSSR